MFFRSAVSLGLAFSLIYSDARGQNDLPLPSNPLQRVPAENGSVDVSQTTKLQHSIRESVKRLRETKNSDEAESITVELTNLLEQDYESRLAVYQQELDQLEAKLNSMKEKLARKRDAKADMIQLRIEVLKAEASDLGWPSPPSSPRPITLRGDTHVDPDEYETYLRQPVKMQHLDPRKLGETNKLIDKILAEHRKAWGEIASGPFINSEAVQAIKTEAINQLPPFDELTPRQVKRIESHFKYPTANDQSETDKRISDALAYRRMEWDKLKESGPTTTIENIEAIRDQTISKLPPFLEMTPKQIRTVDSSGVLQNGPAREEAIRVLEKYAGSPTLDGAFAAYQLFAFAVEYPMEGWPKNESKAERIAKQRVCFERFLNHPQRQLLLEIAPRLHLFFNIRQFDSPETWREHKTEMFGLYHSFLEEQLASRSDLTDCLAVLQAIADEGEKEEVTKYARLKLIEHGKMSLTVLESEESPDNEIEIQMLKGEIQQLEKFSDAGTLLGTEAEPLKVLWSSSDRLKSWSNLSGKTSVLYFSTPSCGPCVKSVPKLIKIQDQLSEAINFVGITSQQGTVPLKRGVIDCADDLEKECELLSEYRSESKINWPILVTQETVFNAAYGVRGVPHMVILDANGIIRDMFNPYLEPEASILQRIELVESK